MSADRLALFFATIADIKNANNENGKHFFDAGSMAFFDSRVEPGVHGGRYFVTSEQFRPSTGPAHARKWTVREAKPGGIIETVGEFQAHASLADAREAIKKLLEESCSKRATRSPSSSRSSSPAAPRARSAPPKRSRRRPSTA